MTDGALSAGLSIDGLDVIAPGAFAAAVAPLFEGARAVPRPPGDGAPVRVGRASCSPRAREIAHAMPLDEQLELIDAHPRLGAPPADVSALSFVEQGYQRDATEREAEAAAAEAERARVAAELDRLNAAYEARFGFRYCVFVAGRSRAELLPELARRARRRPRRRDRSGRSTPSSTSPATGMRP